MSWSRSTCCVDRQQSPFRHGFRAGFNNNVVFCSTVGHGGPRWCHRGRCALLYRYILLYVQKTIRSAGSVFLHVRFCGDKLHLSGFHVLLDLVQPQSAVRGARVALERVLWHWDALGHQRLEGCAHVFWRDKRSHPVVVDCVLALVRDVSNAGRSGTLVEVLVTLLRGQWQSLVTRLRLAVEQRAVLVCFPWSLEQRRCRRMEASGAGVCGADHPPVRAVLSRSFPLVSHGPVALFLFPTCAFLSQDVPHPNNTNRRCFFSTTQQRPFFAFSAFFCFGQFFIFFYRGPAPIDRGRSAAPRTQIHKAQLYIPSTGRLSKPATPTIASRSMLSPRDVARRAETAAPFQPS